MVLWRDQGVVLDSDDDSDAGQLTPGASQRRDDDVTNNISTTATWNGTHEMPARKDTNEDDSDKLHDSLHNASPCEYATCSAAIPVSLDTTKLQTAAVTHSKPRSVFNVSSSPEAILASSPVKSTAQQEPQDLNARKNITQTRNLQTSPPKNGALCMPQSPPTEFMARHHSATNTICESPLSDLCPAASSPSQRGSSPVSPRGKMPFPPATQPQSTSSVTSSPLSDPPTTQSSLLLRPHAPSTPPTEPRGPLGLGQKQPLLLNEDQHHMETANHGHNFRARNPVQLHPYEYDRQQYYRTLNGTGYRPVRVIERSPEGRESPSKGSAIGSENDSSVFVATWQPSRSQTPVYDGEGGSPNSILLGRGVILGEISNSNKRRRLNDATPSQSPAYASPTADNIITKEHRPQVRGKFRHKEFRFPEGYGPQQTDPASRRPRSRPLDDVVNDFFEKGLSSVQPHSRPRLKTVAPDSDDSVSESDDGPISARRPLRQPGSTHPGGNNRVEDTSSDSDHSSRSQRSDPVDSRELKRVRRKIKGVLPASWLRIDQAQRKVVAEVQNPLRSAYRRTPRKPVNQSMIPYSAQQTSPGQREPSVISVETSSSPDDDDDVNGDQASPFLLQEELEAVFLAQPRVSAAFPNDEHGEVQENDWIDDMRPVIHRSRANKSRKKRQSRLSYAIESDAIIAKQSQQRSSRPRSRKRTSNKHDTQLSRFRLSHLGILDALDHFGSQENPDFIRVAARKAKSRADKGRHSPQRKLISLQSREEGIDIDRALRDWTSNKIKVSKKHSQASRMSSNRAPLQERSHNRQILVSSQDGRSAIYEKQKPLLKIPGRHTHLRSFGPHKVKVRQTRLGFQPGRRDDEIARLREPSAANESLPMLMSKYSPLKEKYPNQPDYRRPGMLEELQQDHDKHHRRSAFQRDLLQVAKGQLSRPLTTRSQEANPLLSRFLQDDHGEAEVLFENHDFPKPDPPRVDLLQTQEQKRKASSPRRLTRLRKRPPRQLQIDTDEPHRLQNDCAVSIEDALVPFQDSSEVPSPSLRKIEGLLPDGATYSIDFGISPLPVGIFFHQSTFIGSGLFDKACSMPGRNASCVSGEQIIIIGLETYHLGSWTQSTSSLVRMVFDEISKNIHHLADGLIRDASLEAASNKLKSVVQWVANKLSFLDEIDRQSCTTTLLELLEALIESCLTLLHSPCKPKLSPFWLYLATFGVQLLQLSKSPHVSMELEGRFQACFDSSVEIALRIVLDTSSSDIRQFYNVVNLRHYGESGIRDAVAVETIVGLLNMAERCTSHSFNIWAVIQCTLTNHISRHTTDINDLETAWHSIFAMLPLSEFDSQGVLQRYKRFESPSSAWTGVNTLLARTFDLYETSYNSTASNPYLRAVLSRCHRLIRVWSWQNWDATVKKIYDFFARRGFHFLDNEAGTCSAGFLEHLDTEKSPMPDSRDRSFHIFLKMLATGLSQLRALASEKKVLNTTWRFIPNHGRSHKKEDALRHEDLDAIRNQHDLLCVLYYASPPSARPKVQLIQGLADFETSHLEICRLNVRAWANLTRFQLSINEPPESIGILVSWLNNMLQQLVFLHSHARAEAETLLHNSTSLDAFDLLENVIQSNQRQSEALLSSALNSVADIVHSAKNEDGARELYQTTSISRVFELYKPGITRLIPLMIEALRIYQAFNSRTTSRQDIPVIQESNEESQDYGEFPDLDDFDNGLPALNLQEDRAYGALHHFVSDCLGSERGADDRLLEFLVGVYAKASREQVRCGRRDWAYFLDEHGAGSWAHFRNTETASMFLPYFVASVLEHDPSAFKEAPLNPLLIWMRSLVERESMLKYQHRLTSSLLNVWPQCALLRNLPFASNTDGPDKGRSYSITASEFRERRLGLISAVLENMYKQFHDWDTEYDDTAHFTAADLRQLVQALQSTMKRTYEETQSGSSTRGSYTTFAQQVVSFLQQYVADILPVDRFFTDGSNTFPLPSDDPSYLVGKLKAYAPKLGDFKTQKQLSAFVLNAFTRAAVEDQGSYLVDQITRSMTGHYENNLVGHITLRRCLTQSILPGYIGAALETECGWIVAQPVFEILAITFTSLLKCSDLAHVDSLFPILDMIMTTLANLVPLLASLISARTRYPGKAYSSHAERAYSFITGAFRVVFAAVPTLSLACRLSLVQARPEHAASISHAITVLSILATTIRTRIQSHPDDPFPVRDSNHLNLNPGVEVATNEMRVHWSSTRNAHLELAKYAQTMLHETLDKEWSCREVYDAGSSTLRTVYTVTRGRAQREVVPPGPLFDHRPIDVDEWTVGSKGQVWNISQVIHELDRFDEAVEIFFFDGNQDRVGEHAANAVVDIFV